MITKFNIFIFCISILTILSCKNENDTVLSINNLKISREEFTKKLIKEKNQFEIRNKKKFTETDFNEWLEEYINSIIFDKYLENENIIDDPEVKYMSLVADKYVLLLENSLFIKELQKDIKVTEADIIKCQNLQKITAKIEIINFEEDEIKDIIGFDKCNNEADYEKIKNKAIKAGQSVDTIETNYPSNLIALTIDDFSKIIEKKSYGPFIRFDNPYINNKIYAKIISLQKENTEADTNVNILYEKIEILQKHIALYKKIQFYRKSSNYSENANVILKCYKKLKYIDESSQIDTNTIRENLDDVAISYTLNGETLTYTIREFVKYHHSRPLIWKFSSFEDFKSFFQDIMIADFIWNDKITESFKNNSEFIEKHNNRVKKIAKQYFLKNHIYNKIIVSEEEILKKYSEDSLIYTSPKIITYDNLEYKTEKDAINVKKHFESRSIIPKDIIYENDTLLNKGLISYKKNLTIDSDTLPEELFTLTNNSVSDIYIKDNFYNISLKTDSNGQRKIPFIQVKTKIKDEILNKRKEDEFKKFICKIKENYKIQNSISYSDYF